LVNDSEVEVKIQQIESWISRPSNVVRANMYELKAAILIANCTDTNCKSMKTLKVFCPQALVVACCNFKYFSIKFSNNTDEKTGCIYYNDTNYIL